MAIKLKFKVYVSYSFKGITAKDYAPFFRKEYSKQLELSTGQFSNR